MRLRLFLPTAMLLLAAGAAGAQIPSITIFGGASMPTGDAGDALNTGWVAGAAMDMHMPVTPFGVRLEGSYTRYGVQGLSGTGVTANTSDLGVNLNLVMSMPTPVIKPYITAGPSYSNLKVSASDGTNSASQSEGHYGFNVGGGIDFGLAGLGARVDLRYKHISTGDGSKYTSIPLTFGIRF
jgi:opacity protein-like surface antigen